MGRWADQPGRSRSPPADVREQLALARRLSRARVAWTESAEIRSGVSMVRVVTRRSAAKWQFSAVCDVSPAERALSE